MLIAHYLRIAYHANQLRDWFTSDPVNKGKETSSEISHQSPVLYRQNAT